MMTMEAPDKVLNVLLIEDSAMLCEMVCDLLSDLEHVTVTATAADEATALDELEEHPIDLVIVDLQLREGSGAGVLQHLQDDPERYGHPLPAIFSNQDPQVVKAIVKTLNVEYVFDKSFQLDELLEFVQDAAWQHVDDLENGESTVQAMGSPPSSAARRS